MKINNKFNRILALLLINVVVLFSANTYAEETIIPEISEDVEIEYTEENEEIDDPFIYETEDEKFIIPEENSEENDVLVSEEENISNMISDTWEYAFLKKIGFQIADESKNHKLTREKAAMYLAFLYDIGALPQASNTYFKDVTLENPYLSYINFGCEYGYISGTGGGNFSPKKAITISEFVTVLLRIMGYSDYIQAKGGTVSQIMIFADRYDLLTGISAGFQDDVTEYSALVLLTNAMNMPLCNTMAVEGNNLVYDINSENILLEQNFGITKKYGLICSVHDAALAGHSKSDESCIELDTGSKIEKYVLDKLNADKLLGQDVCCYIKDDKIIYIEQQNNIETLILNYGEYIFSSDRTRVSRENDKGKFREEKIAYDAVYIYNGKQYDNITAEELNSTNTRVEIVDVDHDNVYEVVYVEHNSPMVVEALPDPIYTFGTQIEQYDSPYPMYPDVLLEEYEANPVHTSFIASERSTGKSIELNVNSDEYRLNLIKNGKEFNYENIKTGDLLSICESKDGEKKTVYVSNQKVEDTVSQLDYSNNKLVMTSGEEYTYTFKLPEVSILGKSIVLYIDAYGYAAAYRFADEGEVVYGYLLAYGGSGSSLSKDWKAKIYTMDKKIEVYNFADKFFQNDIKTDGESFKNYFSETGHQLVKYVLNGEGEIKKIYTSTEPQGYSLHKEKPVFVMNEHYNGNTENYGLYKSSIIEQEYSPLNAKRLLVIVDDDGNVIDDRIYLVSSFKADKTHDLKIYDAKTGKIAQFIVCTVNEKDIETYNSLTDFFFVVEDIRIDLEGKFLCGMTRNKGNKPFSYRFYEGQDGMFDDIKSGDIIKIIWYETDENGNYIVSDYEKMFTLKSEGDEDITKTICADFGYSSESKAITEGRITYNKQMYGTILAMSSGSAPEYNIENRTFSIVLQPEGTVIPEDCYVFSYGRENLTSFKLFRYNTERKTLNYENGYNLKPGDKIFVATNWYSASFIVIYE